MDIHKLRAFLTGSGYSRIIWAFLFGTLLVLATLTAAPSSASSGFVTLQDFSLLATSFGTCGYFPASATQVYPDCQYSGLNYQLPSVQLVLPVNITALPITSTVYVSQTFNVKVQIQSGAQQIDGAEAHINFNPAYLRVLQITGNISALPVVLKNEYNNILGTLDYAAGAFTNLPSGNIDLITMQLEAIQPISSTILEFQHLKPRQTDVTYGGASILSSHRDGIVLVLNLNKVFVPLIIK